MGLGAEIFSTLAILEARDQASEIYDKVQLKVGQFSEAMKAAADSADVSGAKIDESFMKTASSADALTLATAKVEAAQAKLDASTKAQADAETALLDAQEKARAAADGDTAAMDKQVAAADRLAAAQKETAKQTQVLKDAQASQKKISEATYATNDESAKKAASSGIAWGSVASTMGKVGLGVVVAGGLLAKGAADFQSSTTHLVTDAGESASQLGRVQTGLLGISSATGTSAKDIVAGMYHIESSIPPMTDASKRAGIALNEMTVAAQGAKVGGADLDTVSQTLAGTLNAYASKGYSATQMMNALISTTGAGDVKMQDLASSLSSVSGIAASAGLDFSQVGGAIATMTSQGWTAQRATQDLASAVSSLGNPNKVAITEMQQLGLNSNDVSMNLGKRGLTGTLDMLTQAVASHTKGGQVLIDTLKSSAAAGADASIMFKQLPKSIDGAASSLLNGTSTAADFNKSIAGLDAPQQHLARQFETLVKNSGSFNSLLTSSSPAAQTYNAAMAKMLGGTTGLNAALAISGGHMGTFKESTGTVGAALNSTSADVTNWSTIQGTFNQKLAVAKTTVENTGISIGTALLPAITSLLQGVMSIVGPIASWVEGHQKLTVIILGAVAAVGLLVGGINLAVKAYKAINDAATAVGKVFSKLADMLGLSKDAQDANSVSANAAAASADGLAVSETAAAEATEASTVATEANTASTGLAAKAFQGVKDAVAAYGKSLSGSMGLFAGASDAMDAEAASADGAAGSMDGLAASEDAATASAEASTVATDANSTSLIRGGLAAAGTAAKIVILKTAQVAARLATEAWKVAQIALNAVMDTSPIVLVAIAIAALVAGVIYAYTHFQAFRDVVQAVWDWLKGAVVDAVGFVGDHWELIVDIFTGPIGIVSTQIYDHWQTIKGYFMDGVHAVESTLSWFASLPGRFASWLSSAASSVAHGIADVVSWWAGLPGRVTVAIFGFFAGLADKFAGWVEGVGTSVSHKGADVLAWFTSLPGKIVNALGNVSSTLWNAGVQLIEGFIGGIGSMFSNVENTLGSLASKLVDWKGPPAKDRILLTDNGKLVIQGLIAGFDQEIPAVQAKLQGLTANIQQTVAPAALPALPAAGLGTSAGGGTTIVQNFDLKGCQVMNDRDMDQLVNKIGTAMATRILPGGGMRTTM